MNETVSRVFVENFLEHEKNEARQWLRHEMDSLVESVFGQLKDKFVAFVAQQNGTALNSTSCEPTQEATGSSSSPQPNSENFAPFQKVVLQVKHEPDGEESLPVNIPDIPHFSQSLPSTSNDLNSLHIPAEMLKLEYEEHPHDDSDTDCDCESCLNLQYDDDDTSNEPQNDAMGSLPNDDLNVGEPKAKRPKVDTIPRPKVLALKCFHGKCQLWFDNEQQLDEHLIDVHQIEQHRCFQMGCGRSFVLSSQLELHLRTDHSNLAGIFTCSKCSKTYPSHTKLNSHVFRLHFEGHYQCGYPNCSYISPSREQLYSHNKTHKIDSQQSFSCQFCGKQFSYSSNLYKHERTHRDVKPYRCRWPDCGFEHKERKPTMEHIRKVHFKLPKKKSKEENPGKEADVRQFLEVVKELLH